MQIFHKFHNSAIEIKIIHRLFSVVIILLLAIGNCFSTSLFATETEIQRPAILIEPNIERSPNRYPDFEKTHFDIVPFIGGYKLDGFNTEALQGIKIGIYPHRRFFIAINYGLSEIDESVRTGLGFLPLLTDTELSYYDLSLGINLLPSQLHFRLYGRRAINTDVYLAAGLGKINITRTDNNDIDDSIINLGMGLRLALAKWLCLHASVKNHIMEESLLNPNTSAQNLSYNLGLGIYF